MHTLLQDLFTYCTSAFKFNQRGLTFLGLSSQYFCIVPFLCSSVIQSRCPLLFEFFRHLSFFLWHFFFGFIYLIHFLSVARSFPTLSQSRKLLKSPGVASSLRKSLLLLMNRQFFFKLSTKSEFLSAFFSASWGASFRHHVLHWSLQCLQKVHILTDSLSSSSRSSFDQSIQVSFLFHSSTSRPWVPPGGQTSA